MPPLEEQVGLDISAALQDADQLATQAGQALEAALTSAVDSFTSSFSTAAQAIQEQIAEALSTEQTVPVGADTTAAQGEVSGLVSEVDATQASIEVDADTSSAEAAVSDLADSAESASQSLSKGADGGSKFAESAGLIAGSAALARGEVGGLTEASGALSFVSGAAVGGVAALGVSVFELAQKGIEAVSAEERFNAVVGETAAQVERVKVGSLTTDLAKLGLQFGSTDSEIKNSASTLFAFATNSGASREEAAKFTTEVTALGARAISLNPALGNLGDVAETLSVRLARGGRFAAAYGLSLTAAEINARALGNTGKTAAADLTIYEKATAAAQIASERYGDTLGKVVADGAKNAANQQKSLRAEITQLLEEAGRPLVAPFLDAIKQGAPAIGAFATSVGQLAAASLPAVIGALQAAVPLLQLASQAIGTLTELTDSLGISATASGAALGYLVGGPIGALVGGLAGLASDLGLFGTAEKTVEEQTNRLAKAIEQASAADALARFNKQVQSVFDNFSKIGGDTSRLDRAAVALRQFKLLAADDAGAAQRVLSALEPGSTQAQQFAVALNQVVTAQKAHTAAQREAQGVTDKLTQSVEDQAKAYNDQKDAILASLDKGFALTHAAEQERDAVDALNSARAEAIKAGKSQAEQDEAVRRAETSAEEAVARAAAAVRAKSLDDYASLGPVAAARQATLDQIGSLEALRGTLDPNKDAGLIAFIDGLIGKLKDPALNGPHVIEIVIRKDQALIAIEDVSRALRGIGVDVPELVITPPASSAGGNRLTGAQALAGSFVGEQGIEFVRGLPGGGFEVYPNSVARSIGGGAPGGGAQMVDNSVHAPITVIEAQGSGEATASAAVRRLRHLQWAMGN